MAMRGIIALMPSAEPRFVASVESVSHALKQASLADEPKNVITQSIIMTRDTPTEAADAAAGNIFSITSVRMRAKLQMDMPQSMYPPAIKSRRLPSLSDSAPIKSVVSVAATALAATITEISRALARNIRYIKTLKYIFSTTHATWPTKLNTVSASQKRGESFVFFIVMRPPFFFITKSITQKAG